MRSIEELNMLLHSRADLPVGLKLTTEEFDGGWSFVRRADSRRLGKRIQTKGWNFIRFADGSLRSGVGATSQEAIASALRLALKRVSTHSNAVEVERIELTRYPWFFLARVRVYPYRIQHGSTLVATPEVELKESGEPISLFGSAMPTLKEMLISSGISETKAA